MYPRALLFSMFVQHFNTGLDVMRIYCMRDLFKRVYKIEPADLQFYENLINIPVFMKIFFGLFIDTKVIHRRANLLVLFGLNSVVTQACIAMVSDMDEKNVLILLGLQNFGTAILDAVIDSMRVEQARCHKRG